MNSEANSRFHQLEAPFLYYQSIVKYVRVKELSN